MLRVYTELLEVANDTYGGETSYKELVNASIEGMVRSLDPHTSFLTAEDYSQMRDRQQSSFFGLGILVGLRNGQITVITPIEGTPASRMGLRAGDVIAAIEGETTEGMSINEAVRQLKGPKGTEVNITISRPGLDEPIEVTIVRDEIPQISVRYQYMVSPQTGYISISDFNRGTAREVREAVEILREQGMQQLLVDLRTNGGGLLDQAIEVVQQFLPEGSKVVETRGRTRDSHQQYFSEDPTPPLDLPMVVLVGEGTASAAEIFAGAIQDHDVGLIVGTQTWGKGLVQTVYSLSYGAGLALTTARYYTPSGRLIQRDYSSWFDYSTHSNGINPAELDSEGGGVDAGLEAYRTDLGRKVYGGGGISPDVIIEPQEIPELLQILLSRNAFFDFAVSYANRHPIESREWQVPDPVLDEFYDWVVEEELITSEELTEHLADPAIAEEVQRNLRGELLNSAFGIEARYEVIAKGDPQILEALTLFEDAKNLLARRQLLLDESGQPEKTASLSE